MKNYFKNAFTMAETLIIMIILGIIATILLATLKPADYKDKALEVLSKKILKEIDTVTTMILASNTKDGTFRTIINPTDNSSSNITSDETNAMKSLKLLYKKHLTSLRKQQDVLMLEVIEEAEPEEFVNCYITVNGGWPAFGFKLKDGALFCMSTKKSFNNIGSAIPKTIIPGENSLCNTANALGYIMFDSNGEKEKPNAYGKDIFVLPFDADGIMYDRECN